ncbi:MAG: c-type cytochrome, partial [Deltaproteobacteria bacterium]|nr:c-type cytochrome [Deltaproteobacteria bacterium]
CATCHLEGQSDAVTWRFKQGPRDTPSNAGGPINTGFLFRQAVRNDVVQYDETVRVEQGGNYHRNNAAQLPDLQALAAFTNFAIPLPQNPFRSKDGTLTSAQQSGKALFSSRCASCHSGDWYTDSGAGNATLDLAGTVTLHDIGTCVSTGAFPDKIATDVAGHARTACDFDTPTLRGVFATPPYFHDGSAPTLEDAILRVPGTSDLSDQQRSDLVAFLKTL